MRKSFSERVVELARSVPEGRVTTYGDLTKAAGAPPMAAQSVTGILSKAYDSGVKDIPFHRIVYSNGKIWINEKYRKERMKLYEKEGILVDTRDRITNFNEIRM